MVIEVGEKAVEWDIFQGVLNRETVHWDIVFDKAEDQQRKLSDFHHPLIFRCGHIQRLRITINFIKVPEEVGDTDAAEELNVVVLRETSDKGYLQDFGFNNNFR